jgi:hypothetical protein
MSTRTNWTMKPSELLWLENRISMPPSAPAVPPRAMSIEVVVTPGLNGVGTAGLTFGVKAD